MNSEVIVAFGRGKEYDFHFTEADLAASKDDQARRWLDQQWQELDCMPSHPMGKVLLLDMILGVAKYGGERRFAERDDWADTFARYTAVLLKRPAVRVDVAEHRVG